MNELSELTNPIFDGINDFIHDKNSLEINNYKNKLIVLLEQLELGAKTHGLNDFVIRDIKYGLTAFIDEMVLTSDWVQKTGWFAQTLQIKFFGDHLAGERFFEKLNNARVKGGEYLPVLQVYYTCLELGFAGIYRIRNSEYLITLKRELKEQISKYLELDLSKNLHLSKEKSFVQQRQSSFLFDPMVWVLTIAIISFATFVGYKQAMDQYETKLKVDIHE